MIDVRNAIASIVDRYTLADIVEITLRKMRRNKIPLPFVAKTTSGSDGRRRSERLDEIDRKSRERSRERRQLQPN